MPISFTCPHCGARIKGKDKALGKIVACPKCNGSIAVPTADALQSVTPVPEPENLDPFWKNHIEATAEPGVAQVDDTRRKNRLFLAVGVAVVSVLVLVTGLFMTVLLLAYGRDDQEETLKLMATELKNYSSVRAKNNQLASAEAEKKLRAELGRIEGKELTWRLEVSEVSVNEVTFFNRYELLRDGSWRLARGSGPFLDDITYSSKVGDLTCFIGNGHRQLPKREFGFTSGDAPGTYIEIGKLLSPDKAKLLARGDFVKIRGKVHLRSINATSGHLEMEFVEVEIVDTGKGSRAANETGSPEACCNCSWCMGGSCTGGILMIVIPICLIALPTTAGIWKSFDKAGEPGWAALVPLYNWMIMARIAGKGDTYAFLCLIPLAGPIFLIIIIVEFCKKFDVGAGFAWGLILLPFVFWPMLGLGSARYVGTALAYQGEDEYRS